MEESGKVGIETETEEGRVDDVDGIETAVEEEDNDDDAGGTPAREDGREGEETDEGRPLAREEDNDADDDEEEERGDGGGGAAGGGTDGSELEEEEVEPEEEGGADDEDEPGPEIGTVGLKKKADDVYPNNFFFLPDNGEGAPIPDDEDCAESGGRRGVEDPDDDADAEDDDDVEGMAGEDGIVCCGVFVAGDAGGADTLNRMGGTAGPEAATGETAAAMAGVTPNPEMDDDGRVIKHPCVNFPTARKFSSNNST